MKKITLTLAVALGCCYAYGQNTFPLTGNVGIGTTNPTQALSVVGTIVGTHISIQGNLSAVSDVDARIYLSNTTPVTGQNWNLISQTNGSFETGIYGFAPFYTITSGGNVGIGTTAPANKFVVENDGNSNNYHMAGFYNNSTGSGAAAGIEIMAGNAGVGGGGLLFYKGSGQSTDPNGFFIDNSQNAPLGLMTNNTERMRINAGGNVGIGTTMPDQKLTVKGTVHASEVKVDLNVPGPDYVFSADYELTSLGDLKAYVEKNHHLPEIPSAEQMAKDGLNLGELNIRLLKKVEELTLYLMEKDEQEKKQKILINEQQAVNQVQAVQLNTQHEQLLTQQDELSQLKRRLETITKALNITDLK